jgi:hypothetical protein
MFQQSSRNDTVYDIFLLEQWGMFRVTTPIGLLVPHATGLAREFPELSHKHVVTSAVKSLSEDRKRLVTLDHEYALEMEVAEFPEDFRREHMFLYYIRSQKMIPDMIEWLRPNGAVYATAERDEIEATIEKDKRVIEGRAIARRKEALQQAKANGRIEGAPDYTCQEQEDYVEGKISAAEAKRRIIQRYKKD